MVNSRKPWVGGNWKCNGTKASIDQLCGALNKAEFDPKAVDVVICPTILHISHVANTLKKDFIIASQNISKTCNGAYTGEVSVEILKDFGINWTLIGHSERRQYYGETNAVVAAKTSAAQKGGIFAAVCVGETLAERESGTTEIVLKEQLQAIIPQITDWSRIVIAYEPVWAIGTGKVATVEQAQSAHEIIRKFVDENVTSDTAQKLRIVYGGSVTDQNCRALAAEKDIDGFLVGGASLKPTFADIIQSCAA